jgi:hypothetical protein
MEYTILKGGIDTINYKTNAAYSEVKITNKEVGAKTTYFTVKTDDGKSKKCYVQTPKLLVTKGVDVYQSPDGDKYYLELSLSTNNVDESLAKEINQFKDFIQEFDDYNIQQGLKNSPAWIGKKASEEIVRDKYHPMLRYSKDEEGNISDRYPPSIRFRLYTRDSKFTTECYDSKRNLVDLQETIQKGCRVTVMYHQQSCWLNKNTGYGASNKLMQIKVYPSTKLTGYAFIDDDEDEEGADNNEEENLQEDEDNEEEEVNEDLDAGVEEEEVEVKPAPKKGGRKKKTAA